MKMRKNIFVVCAMLCALSCTKHSDPSKDINLEGYTMVQAATEEIMVLQDVPYADVWSQGDCIGVFGDQSGENVCYTLRRDDDQKESGRFYGPLVKGGLTAYYPYNSNSVMTDGYLPFELESLQSFNPDASAREAFLGCSNITVASLESDGKMHFGYPLGIIAFRFLFDETINVQSMSLSSQQALSGRLYADSKCDVKGGTLSAKAISLDFGGALVPSREGQQCRPFYFVVPPASYPAKSLSLEIVTDTETMHILLKAVDVPRVNGADFEVTTVEVNASDLPGFEIDNGILE